MMTVVLGEAFYPSDPEENKKSKSSEKKGFRKKKKFYTGQASVD